MVSEKYHQVGFHCICTKSSSVGIKVPIPPLCTAPGVVSFVCILPERPLGMYGSMYRFRHPRYGGFREVSFCLETSEFFLEEFDQYPLSHIMLCFIF